MAFTLKTETLASCLLVIYPNFRQDQSRSCRSPVYGSAAKGPPSDSLLAAASLEHVNNTAS